MSITTGTILRVVAQFLWTDGNINQNVFNAVVTGAGGPWDDADIVDDALAWLNVMYANLTVGTSDEIDGNNVTVYKYDSVDDDWDEVGSNSWVWNPSNVADQLPRGSGPLVRLWTTDPDVQGKKYIPGSVEANLTDGLFIGALLANLLDFCDDWATAFVGATSGASWAPGIWSVVGKILVVAVDHYAVSAIPAYQRRRKRTVGI